MFVIEDPLHFLHQLCNYRITRFRNIFCRVFLQIFDVFYWKILYFVAILFLHWCFILQYKKYFLQFPICQISTLYNSFFAIFSHCISRQIKNVISEVYIYSLSSTNLSLEALCLFFESVLENPCLECHLQMYKLLKKKIFH